MSRAHVPPVTTVYSAVLVACSAVLEAEANAEYDPTVNALFIPAAILNPPFFDKSYAVARNFGAVGWIVGHEVRAVSLLHWHYMHLFFL
jgi:hypothetical protein